MVINLIGDVNLDHLVKVLNVRFPHSKSAISAFVVNKYLGQDTLQRIFFKKTYWPQRFCLISSGRGFKHPQ